MAHDAKNVWAAVVRVCYLKSFFVRYNISLANNLNANHIRAMDEYDRKRMKLMMSLTQTSKAYKTVADKRVSGFGLSQAMAMPSRIWALSWAFLSRNLVRLTMTSKRKSR